MIPVVAAEVESLSRGLASLGSYFEVSLRGGGAAVSPPWRPMSELVDGGPALRDRVEVVQAVLAQRAGLPASGVEARVAASVAQLGLVARLVSPYVGAAVLTGAGAAAPNLDGAWWQPATGGAFPLSLPVGDLVPPAPPETGPGEVDVAAAAAALRRGLVDGPVAQLVASVGGAFDVSPKVLWGNVGSAVNAVAIVVAHSRPDLGPRTRDVVRQVLDHPLVRVPGDGLGPAYRRRSCCLIYRAHARRSAAASDVCGDCVLAAAGARGPGG